jgi:spore maturation protein CgeB
MRILFVGSSWQGSSARSLREAIEQISPGTLIGDVADDHYVPAATSLPLRVAYRLLNRYQRAELATSIQRKVVALEPDVLLVYKGHAIDSQLVSWAKARGVYTVNIFPDLSPLAHGKPLASSMGLYDLVISTKSFHPRVWSSHYGYTNSCVCVPHGYDPQVHLWTVPSDAYSFDVVLAASWRKQYHDLVCALAKEAGMHSVRFAIMGPGWSERSSSFPGHWHLEPGQIGRAYGEWLRRGKIAIAPVHSDHQHGGRVHPGDEDTTRTYELAAAHCFFLHRRTPFVSTTYDETSEVPMWKDASELGELIRRFLHDDAARERFAAAAHRRAVPAYSIPARAHEVMMAIGGGWSRR